MFYSDSESELEQIILIFFPVLPFVFVILIQRSLIILQGAGFDERLYPESNLAFECQYFPEPDPKPYQLWIWFWPKKFQASHSCEYWCRG